MTVSIRASVHLGRTRDARVLRVKLTQNTCRWKEVDFTFDVIFDTAGQSFMRCLGGLRGSDAQNTNPSSASALAKGLLVTKCRVPS